MKCIYTVVHEHRFGISTYVVRCDHLPTQAEVIEELSIDFEPNREETITIEEIEIIDIPMEDS